MSVKGVIQNEECIIMTLYEGREFIIPCSDSKDANSKRVSLYNARRRLSVADQKKVRIQKERLGEAWVVKISPGQQEILEVINGKLVPYEEEVMMPQRFKDQMLEMLKNGLDEEEIIESLVLRGQSVSTIKMELAKVAV